MHTGTSYQEVQRDHLIPLMDTVRIQSLDLQVEAFKLKASTGLYRFTCAWATQPACGHRKVKSSHCWMSAHTLEKSYCWASTVEPRGTTLIRIWSVLHSVTYVRTLQREITDTESPFRQCIYGLTFTAWHSRPGIHRQTTESYFLVSFFSILGEFGDSFSIFRFFESFYGWTLFVESAGAFFQFVWNCFQVYPANGWLSSKLPQKLFCLHSKGKTIRNKRARLFHITSGHAILSTDSMVRFYPPIILSWSGFLKGRGRLSNVTAFEIVADFLPDVP